VTNNRRKLFVLRVATSAAALLALAACRQVLGLDGEKSTLDDGGGADGEASEGASGDVPNGDGATSADGASNADGAKSDAMSKGDGGALDAAKGGDATQVISDWARWPMPATSPGAANYTLTTDTALDHTTNLMWQRDFSARILYSDAAAYCTSIANGGFNDWRVPTWIELVSIIDYGRTAPAIDPTAFPGVPSDWFWSSSVVGVSGLQQSVYFFQGNVVGLDTGMTQLWRVRCVRNP
jgi:hypothetical protein